MLANYEVSDLANVCLSWTELKQAFFHTDSRSVANNGQNICGTVCCKKCYCGMSLCKFEI